MTQDLKVGDRVRLVARPPYIKTAEPMPMLRPPDVVALDEEGIIVDQRPGGYFSVRFNRGSFLLDSQYLVSLENSPQERNLTETPVDSDQQ